jgi:hypothetical protein
MVPATLLENITVQKTYTADRPGEFGGGDVQVHTKDFPGIRTWQVQVSGGYTGGVTFRSVGTYAGSPSDRYGFGSAARGIPSAVFETAGNRPLVLSSNPGLGFDQATLAEVARSFNNVWSPSTTNAPASKAYAASYGDELKVSATVGRRSVVDVPLNTSRTVAMLLQAPRTRCSTTPSKSMASRPGGLVVIIDAPRHLHAGFYTNVADDEVRRWRCPQIMTIITGTGLQELRLMYVQRNILRARSRGTRCRGGSIDWRVCARGACQQPDRRG